MAWAIERETRHTAGNTLIRHVYREQDTAIRQIHMEEAARGYWDTYTRTGDRLRAVDVARGFISPDELHSDEFWHILNKRKP